jgi:hypothetical protein
MKKILLFTLLPAMVFLYSCEDLLTDKSAAEIAIEISGVWSCDEDITLKSTMDNFTVEIWPTEFDSTTVYIGNFNGLGSDIISEAIINNNYTLTIPNQTLTGGFDVRGSGTISQNLKEINLNYFVDDGSGIEDEFNATLTFLRDF